MAIDPEILQSAIAALKTRKCREEAELTEKRLKMYEELPELQRLDAALTATVVKTLSISKDVAEQKKQLAELRDENLQLQEERARLLIKNGQRADCLDSKIHCDLCRDSGFRDDAICDCLVELCKTEGRRRLSSLLDLRGQTFERFRTDIYSDELDPRYPINPRENAVRLLGFCRGYVNSFRPGAKNLLFIGSPGLGKTYLSAAIAGEVTDMGYSVIYDTVISIIASMEREKFERTESEEDSRRFFKCDLLIIDDLGTEMTTPFAQSALYTLVNGRLLENAATIINTNLTMEELDRRYNRSLVSRLRGAYETILFFGSDLRKILNKG